MLLGGGVLLGNICGDVGLASPNPDPTHLIFYVPFSDLARKIRAFQVKMVNIYTLLQTKMAKKTYPFGLHMQSINQSFMRIIN